MHIFTNAGITNINSMEKELLYICPDEDTNIIHSAIQLLMINNISESTASVTVTINIKRFNIEVILLKDSKIEAGSALIIERILNLQPGDSIYLIAEEENTLSTFCSILEVS